jgi:hypothetical protein
MPQEYLPWFLERFGKERMNKGDEALAMMHGGDLSAWLGGPEVIDLGDDLGDDQQQEGRADDGPT